MSEKYISSKVVETLSKINVNDKVEKKNGLTYLSWAWAWGVLKEYFPTATYTIYENKDGWNYHTDGRTAWVKTGVTVEGIEHVEMLPVMDFRNKSIPLEQITSFDVNKAIQRSITKAISRHSLALYIFAGEDLPEDNSADSTTKVTDFKANQIAKAVVGDPNQKVRPNTLEQLEELFEELLPENKDKVQKFLLKNGVLKFSELTETTARTLLLNIQGSMTNK
jgi:hypothetical protein